jgi:hypothetical protein
MILIVFIPIVAGGVILWLIFRNVNRKYCDLFIKIIETARKNPDAVYALVNNGDETERRDIVRQIAAIDNVTKIDILKAGKKLSQVRLRSKTLSEEKIYFVELSSDGADWGISQFSLVE